MKAIQPQAVLFDWDGTLVDTIPGLRVAHNHVRTSFGYPPWTEDEFWLNLRHSSRELYPRLYGNRSNEALEMLYGFIRETHLEHLSVLPGALELLQFLKSHNVPCAVVSNKRHEVMEREIAHLNWDGFFFAAIGAGKAVRDKPSADPVLMALDMAPAAIDPTSAWFVGDTETDIRAAQAAGCPSILLTHGTDKTDLMERFLPSLVLKDCHALMGALQKNPAQGMKSPIADAM